MIPIHKRPVDVSCGNLSMDVAPNNDLEHWYGSTTHSKFGRAIYILNQYYCTALW